MVYWPELAVGNAAHLANGLLTRSLQLDRPTYAPASRSVAFTLTVFSFEYQTVEIWNMWKPPDQDYRYWTTKNGFSLSQDTDAKRNAVFLSPVHNGDYSCRKRRLY